MLKTFRLRKSIKYVGMSFALLFFAVSAGYSGLFFLDQPAEHGFKGEHSAAAVGVMGLTLFGSMLLMSLYQWAAYYVVRFTIDGTTLRMRSIFQNRNFDVSELQRMQWGTRPRGGSFVLHALGCMHRVSCGHSSNAIPDLQVL